MTRACFLVEQECDKTHVYMAMRNSVMKNQNYIATASIASMLAVMFVGAIRRRFIRFSARPLDFLRSR
jgi:hypothetical protein